MPDQPTITVTEHGPYRLCGDVALVDASGTVLSTSGTRYLCRCGGSRSKPLCDATHAAKAFDGAETAGHDTAEQRRDTYEADGLTVHDDRARCAHAGQCTDRLPGVFRATEEPFVDLSGADPDTTRGVVAGCPSGALSSPCVAEPEEPSVRASTDGPYHLRGDVLVVGADGRPYERRPRQALCRCGHSGRKPFCDGSHWYAGFRDPLPPELAARPPTLLEWAGGTPAIERLTQAFYRAVLERPDPVLEPVFRGMPGDHPQHVAAWLTETFSGPPVYTDEHGGYEHMLAKHRDLGLTEPQRRRWVALMVETADAVGLPSDAGFRSAFVAYLEWGTRLAVDNSRPGAPVMAHAPVPRWGWGETPPYVPQPWDDPMAAVHGRERYAREHPPAGQEAASSSS